MVALRQLPQEPLVLLLQLGQAAAQGSLPALGLPQPLLQVLEDGDSWVRARLGGWRQLGLSRPRNEGRSAHSHPQGTALPPKDIPTGINAIREEGPSRHLAVGTRQRGQHLP